MSYKCGGGMIPVTDICCNKLFAVTVNETVTSFWSMWSPSVVGHFAIFKVFFSCLLCSSKICMTKSLSVNITISDEEANMRVRVDSEMSEEFPFIVGICSVSSSFCCCGRCCY